MSHIIKSLKPRHILEVYRAAGAIPSRQGHFFPEFKPARAPKTEEERIQAANKYNLLPQEYDNYEDGSGFGDYPKRPYISVDSKDPWYPWDNPELRQNYNDPINEHGVILLPEMLTTGKPYISYWRSVRWFLYSIVASFWFFYYFSTLKVEYPLLEKQLVTPGVKHYTFEPDYDELRRRNKKRCVEEDEELKEKEKPEEKGKPKTEEKK